MAKEEVVTKAAAEFHAAQDQALVDAFGSVYDLATADQKAIDGQFSQADIEKAVADVKAVDQKIFDDAVAAHEQEVASIKAAFEELATKELVEASTINGLQQSMDKIQGALDALKSLFAPKA